MPVKSKTTFQNVLCELCVIVAEKVLFYDRQIQGKTIYDGNRDKDGSVDLESTGNSQHKFDKVDVKIRSTLVLIGRPNVGKP